MNPKEDPVNLFTFKELGKYLISDLVDIIKEYSTLPSWCYIGGWVMANPGHCYKLLYKNRPYIITEINRDPEKPNCYNCVIVNTYSPVVCIGIDYLQESLIKTWD